MTHATPPRPSPATPGPTPADDLDVGRDLEHLLNARLARWTGGISPTAMRLAAVDWLAHLQADKAKQNELMLTAARSTAALAAWATHATEPGGEPAAEPADPDPRFAHPAWQVWPFNIAQQSFLLTEQWWRDATTGVRGVSPHHEDVVRFTARQWLDALSPANFWWANPEVQERMRETAGANLWQGGQNFLEDARRAIAGQAPAGVDAYVPGVNVAVTAGEVVYRNRLIELIRYTPTTTTVRPEPVLIVPAWIMKYYIMDLSPDNSLIKYLVDHGHTVFAISWLNPTADDRDLGMDDYLRLGVMAALDTVGGLLPRRKVHAVGYCLGGTLLAIAAAAMARDADDRLASVSLFAAQTDFTEPGELDLFIDDSQVSFLEDIMWKQGYLDSSQMAGAFQLIRSNDLIWSRVLKEYLIGERPAVNDLMAWNADGTRLPYRMHSEYLRRMFLHNELACGSYLVDGRPVALSDIACPMFGVGTVRDHVAPWRSVHKLHLLTDCELTFVLSSGGHNVGIVNPPGVPGRRYQALTRPHDGQYLDPDAWLAVAPHHEGSWWPHWLGWLQQRSGKAVRVPAGAASGVGTALCAAPGTYVMQK
jgi:polyhydroxyalkanoate synthase